MRCNHKFDKKNMDYCKNCLRLIDPNVLNKFYIVEMKWYSKCVRYYNNISKHIDQKGKNEFI